MRRVPTVALLIAGVLGCGGSTFNSSDAGTDGGSGSSSGSSSGGSSSGGSSGGSPCPAALPPAGAPCSGPSTGVTCEWGTNPVSECDTVMTCNFYHWEIHIGPNPGGVDCHPAPAASCPPSFASVPRMSHCSPYGSYCDYPEGRCACSIPAVGGVPVDASAEAIWICPDPGNTCPARRPVLGTPCSPDGSPCDYGACTIPGGEAEQCSGGMWVDALVACPLAAKGR
jgi:hypothetical protein